MELFDVGVVAERVRPPARDVVHTVSFYIFEKLPAAICGAGEFGFFFRFALGHGCFVLGDLYVRNGTEVWFPMQNHGLVGVNRTLDIKVIVG